MHRFNHQSTKQVYETNMAVTVKLISGQDEGFSQDKL